MQTSRADPDEDLVWCHDAVQGVSRTFAITIDILEEPMATDICIGYLLCRVADTIEDASHLPAEVQAELLRAHDRALETGATEDVNAFCEAVDPWIPPAAERDADWDVVAQTPRVMRAFDQRPDAVKEAIRPPARELVGGMAEFVDRYAEEGGLRIQTSDELEEYCYYAAGTVGRLITNLVCDEDTSRRTKRHLYGTARSFGLLLQLVNVAKDVHDDRHEENNVYLPAEWLHGEGVPQEAICAPEHEVGAAAVVRRTAEHARTFADDAQAYLEAVPETRGNRLAAWTIPFLLSIGTIRELSSRPHDALSDTGVKVSRDEVHAVIAETLGTSDRATIEEFRRRISTEPFHHV